jgi:nitrite reductase (NADH) large subunit
MSQEHFVVVGDGPAGNSAALTLRDKAPQARVTLISKNREGYYSPHRLPDYLAGQISEQSLFISTPESYKKMGIKFRCGQEVVQVRVHERTLIMDHKEILPFSGLIIAVGGKPRIPEYLVAFHDFMYTLKTLEDARLWSEQLRRAESVLLIGGDLTSLAVTKALLFLRKKVYFVLHENAFWPLRPGPQVFEEVTRRLSRSGVEVLTGDKIRRLAQVSESLYDVQLDDQRIRVGMIGAFFGLIPDIGFLEGSGLRIDRGILVDEYLNTGFPGVYATGDCAQIYHPEIRDYWVSIGHDNARALGQIAALNLVGCRVPAKVEMESVFDVEGIKVNTSWWTEF